MDVIRQVSRIYLDVEPPGVTAQSDRWQDGQQPIPPNHEDVNE